MSKAIGLEHISKRFRVPLDRSTTLKYRVVHWRSASRYRDLDALHDISFDVGFGEFIGIIGHNGSGKSTLLKILARIFPPTTGRMTIDGSVSPFLELGVGFNPELTARENIFVNGSILGLSRPELRRRMDGIIGFAELEDFVDQKLKNFSTGMQVRLAFSVAIQANADILLMDEVIAVGDSRFQQKCLDIFARHRREGRTVVLVTHDLHAVESYCDRAVLLDHGHLITDGAPADVVYEYRRRDANQDAERDAVPDPGEEDADRSAGVWGSGEAHITAIELRGPDGRATHHVRTDQPMQIRITYEVTEPIQNLVVSIGVLRSDGLPLASDDTRREGVDLGAQAPGTSGVVTYAIDDVRLLAGSYLISAALSTPDAGRPIFSVEPSHEFHVADPAGRSGVVNLGGRWEVDGVPAIARVHGTRSISRSA